MVRAALIACVWLALLGLIQAIDTHFEVVEGRDRCFLAEVPQDTLVLLKWKPKQPIPGANPPYNVDLSQLLISGSVFDPQGAEFLNKQYSPTSQIMFTSRQGGEYKLCIRASSANAGWFSGNNKWLLDVDLQVGESAIDYEELAQKQHLDTIEVSLNKILAKLNDIAQEQHYQKGRDVEFRDTTENTNDRVKWWSVIQTLILFLCGLWQINHLKKYFKSRKIV